LTEAILEATKAESSFFILIPDGFGHPAPLRPYHSFGAIKRGMGAGATCAVVYAARY
jgi:hypothetical protein